MLNTNTLLPWKAFRMSPQYSRLIRIFQTNQDACSVMEDIFKPDWEIDSPNCRRLPDEVYLSRPRELAPEGVDISKFPLPKIPDMRVN